MDEPWWWGTILDPVHDDYTPETAVSFYPKGLSQAIKAIQTAAAAIGEWAQRFGKAMLEVQTYVESVIKTDNDKRLFHMETMKLARSEAALRILKHRNPKQCRRLGRSLRRLNAKAYTIAMREQFGNHRGC